LQEYHKLFNSKSKLYETARPAYPEELFQHLSDVCSSRNRVWDCGCGNGQAAESLAKIFKKVSATDISEQQIRNAKLRKNIEYAVSSAEQTEFADNSFDLVCVAQALHWFHFETFWPEVTRVIKPNGVFSTWGYTWPSISPDLDRIFKELVLDKIEPYWAPQNRLLWDHYVDINFPFNKVDSPDFTMEVSWNINQFFDFIHTFSATRQCMKNQGTLFFETAFNTMSRVWGSAEEKRIVHLDFVFYAGKIRK